MTGRPNFLVNPEADASHQRALGLALRGEFQAAFDDFAGAETAVNSRSMAGPDQFVQQARIVRDWGFTEARAELAEWRRTGSTQVDYTPLTSARSRLTVSEATTSLLLEDHATLSPRLTRELYAEHGATVGVLARLATTAQVMCTGDDAVDDARVDAIDAQARRQYREAHAMLLRGSNGYYRTSNALASARHEAMNRRRRNAAQWHGRALAGVAWTAVYNPSNLVSAGRTVLGRTLQLRSAQAAKASVHPGHRGM